MSQHSILHRTRIQLFENMCLQHLCHLHDVTMSLVFVPMQTFNTFLRCPPQKHDTGRTQKKLWDLVRLNASNLFP